MRLSLTLSEETVKLRIFKEHTLIAESLITALLLVLKLKSYIWSPGLTLPSKKLRTIKAPS